MSKVSFGDLKAQYTKIKIKIDSTIQKVIDETAFIKGKYVKSFEEDYAEKYGVENCIGVANGTDALYVSQKSLGIGRGDEVITVANSWISTSETISQTGAKPVFVDIEPEYYGIDTDKIEDKISSDTKAIIPVHIYGQPVDMAPIVDICEDRGLHLIEDCAQAHFAEYNGRKVGTFGEVGTFSFYPGKNLGAYGDAGAIITNDKKLANNMRRFANHGALKKHHHEIEGINSRLDGLQAAILSVKLPYIDDWNTQRLENAHYYNKLLDDVVKIPKIREKVRHIFHLYVIRSDKRNGLSGFLQENEVETGVHYPRPLPFLKAYEYLEHKSGDFPVVESYQNKILSLPMYPELPKADIKRVSDLIHEFHSGT